MTTITKQITNWRSIGGRFLEQYSKSEHNADTMIEAVKKYL